MNNTARERIEQHRLFREVPAPDREMIPAVSRRTLMQHTLIHVAIFIASFIYTTGVAVLAVLLWVRPDSFVAIVLTGLLAAGVFVGSFSLLRMVVFHKLLDEYPEKEEDPGVTHHVAKSVAYALVALVLAALLAGLLARSAAGEAGSSSTDAALSILHSR